MMNRRVSLARQSAPKQTGTAGESEGMVMRIEDLLEFEGLTADHVRAWLQRKGFTLHEVRSGRQCWVRGTEAVTDDTLTASGTLVYLASVVADCSMQSLLSEINPRMRPGWPTEEELERHAFWMVRTLSDGGIRVLGSYVAHEWKKADIKVACWPCDAHGNKVRLATDDKRRG